MGTPTTDIGPGLGAFVAFFAMAVLLWLLMRNMNARMRRMAYRERDRVDALEPAKRKGPISAPPAGPKVRNGDPLDSSGAGEPEEPEGPPGPLLAER